MRATLINVHCTFGTPPRGVADKGSTFKYPGVIRVTGGWTLPLPPPTRDPDTKRNAFRIPLRPIYIVFICVMRICVFVMRRSIMHVLIICFWYLIFFVLFFFFSDFRDLNRSTGSEGPEQQPQHYPPVHKATCVPPRTHRGLISDVIFMIFPDCLRFFTKIAESGPPGAQQKAFSDGIFMMFLYFVWMLPFLLEKKAPAATCRLFSKVLIFCNAF